MRTDTYICKGWISKINVNLPVTGFLLAVCHGSHDGSVRRGLKDDEILGLPLQNICVSYIYMQMRKFCCVTKGENCVGAFCFEKVFDDLSYLLQHIVSANTIPT